MIYLVFNTKSEADAAQEKIASNMGLGADITKQYAIPTRTAESKWAFIKPESRYMAGVDKYTEFTDPVFPVVIFNE